MKRFRFNTKVGRSVGLGVFRSTGCDYPTFYRTLYERGRNDLIVATVDYSTTICGDSSYTDVRPVQRCISDNSNVWSEFYWLHEEVVAWTTRRMSDIRRVYDFLIDEHGKEFFDKHYTPVFYDNVDTTIQKDFSLFAQHLMEDCAGWKSMELYNFALRTLNDGRLVMYARTQWLMGFKS
jgi:hypothetical protein